MRIKVLRNLGRGLPSYKEGEVVDVEPAEAARLCKLNLAEVVESKIKAVPAKPAIAETKSPELKGDAKGEGKK